MYVEYIRAASKTGFVFFLLATILQQAATVVGNLVLRSWGEHNQQAGNNSNMGKYMLVYGLSSFSSVLFSGAASILLLVLCSLRSAKQLHDTVSDPMSSHSLILMVAWYRCWILWSMLL